jgi:hypothetical protein
VIANCPACGTHFKQPPIPAAARGRCGRCDAAVDLTQLRPYRLVKPSAPTPRDAARAASHLPIGLDDPSLATAIASRVAASGRAAPAEIAPLPITVAHAAPTPAAACPTEATESIATIPLAATSDAWDTDDPLPSIPEMAAMETDILGAQRIDETKRRAPAPQQAEGRWTTFALWLIAGAIVGTGVSWTLGGTTEWGVGAGAIAGALTGWGWLRWTSPQ